MKWLDQKVRNHIYTALIGALGVALVACGITEMWSGDWWQIYIGGNALLTWYEITSKP